MSEKINCLLAKYGAMLEVARNLPTEQEYRALARIVLALMTSKPAEYIQVAKSATLDDWLSNQHEPSYYFAIKHYNQALEDLSK